MLFELRRPPRELQVRWQRSTAHVAALEQTQIVAGLLDRPEQYVLERLSSHWRARAPSTTSEPPESPSRSAPSSYSVPAADEIPKRCPMLLVFIPKRQERLIADGNELRNQQHTERFSLCLRWR